MSQNEPALNVNIAGMQIKNPVIAASGCYGYGRDYLPWIAPEKWGGITLKGTTLQPRQGNPPPRVIETPSGIINSVGLQNPGIENVLKEEVPGLREHDTGIILNIAGEALDEYVALARRINEVREIDAVEINVSCPNVEKGGISFGTEPGLVAELVSQVRSAYDGPLIVKLSPLGDELPRIARAAEEAGADAISLINTVKAMTIDVESLRPMLVRESGGLSGPAIRPIAVRAVWEVSQVVQVPIVGMGGITCASDALQFILAGARAVSIGTANFVNPLVVEETVQGIEEYMAKKGFQNIEEMCGFAKRG